MQQPNAACIDRLDTVLVAFFRPSTSENTPLALMVFITCYNFALHYANNVVLSVKMYIVYST